MTKAKRTPGSKPEAPAPAPAGDEDLSVAEAEAEARAGDPGGAALADDWAAALAEQQTQDEDGPRGAEALEPAGAQIFKPLDRGGERRPAARDLDMIIDIPVKLNVELGRTRLTIKQLLELSEGSVLELDGLAGDPLDILINGYLVAQGEVVVVDDKYGIRITEIITPSERVHKLNR